MVVRCASRGVKCISLTDHDTMAGVRQAQAAGKLSNIEVIPGVEVSAETADTPNTHILGFFSPALEHLLGPLHAQLEKLREGRAHRGRSMVEKLARMNIHIEWQRVVEIAGTNAVGRPHIARAMVEKGIVKCTRDAFDRFLGNNGPAYSSGVTLSPEAAVQLIRQAGGLAVLAHPWTVPNPEDMIARLAKAGLHGVEVFKDPGKAALYGALADELGLLKTGGSDFHGTSREEAKATGKEATADSHGQAHGGEGSEVGEISFSSAAVDSFLAAANAIWQRHLRAEVSLFAQQAKLRTKAPKGKGKSAAATGSAASAEAKSDGPLVETKATSPASAPSATVSVSASAPVSPLPESTAPQTVEPIVRIGRYSDSSEWVFSVHISDRERQLLWELAREYRLGFVERDVVTVEETVLCSAAPQKRAHLVLTHDPADSPDSLPPRTDSAPAVGSEDAESKGSAAKKEALQTDGKQGASAASETKPASSAPSAPAHLAAKAAKAAKHAKAAKRAKQKAKKKH